jgi:hypothetical protein
MFLIMCAEKDLNLRSPKATDLQSVVIDHSTIDAGAQSHFPEGLPTALEISIAKIFYFERVFRFGAVTDFIIVFDLICFDITTPFFAS